MRVKEENKSKKNKREQESARISHKEYTEEKTALSGDRKLASAKGGSAG